MSREENGAVTTDVGALVARLAADAVEAMREDLFIDDHRLRGTSPQEQRMEHYAGIAAQVAAKLIAEAVAAERAKVVELERERDLHNGHRRIAEAKLMALTAGAVLGGKVLVPVEPDEEMLAATCDENGRMRLLEFTKPEERSKAFLMPRYTYRAIIAFVRARTTGGSDHGE